ncbi:MAG: ABC transporter permease subunit [Actinomycetota bacterium]|nr:ABC transporter permease subunit [Actinomycetota bacterium]
MVKFVLLMAVNALVLLGIQVMLSAGEGKNVIYAVVAAIALVVIDYIYLSPRAIAGKYLLPGTLFLLVFALYPVIYTMYVSFTNYGTGNILAKGQAIERIEQNSIGAAEGAVRYDLQIVAEDAPTGALAYLLTDTDGNWFLGTAEGLAPVATEDVDQSTTKPTIAGYVALNAGAAQDRADEIAAFRVPTEGGEIQNDGFSEAFAKLQRLKYDSATNTVVDTVDGTAYTEKDGAFVSADGDRLDPGWRAFIGTANYERINSENVRGPFLRVFVWTFVFAAGSVLLTFGLGLLLAIVFSNERMKGRKFYRLVMIVPYALPSFMTALVWRGMLNQQFGIINRVFGFDLPWLDGQWMPYASILMVNLWLGFPYMFLVCTGALQSIPGDLKEAAVVDGATGFTAFRRVTLPLLLITVAPLLIASFAFNFNNFNIIYLLTEGRPPVSGSVAGRTDILISYTYKLAFSGGRGQDLGFASAISVIIFAIVASISAFSFRYTKAFEEIK